jgi:hypothetical protein
MNGIFWDRRAQCQCLLVADSSVPFISAAHSSALRHNPRKRVLLHQPVTPRLPACHCCQSRHIIWHVDRRSVCVGFNLRIFQLVTNFSVVSTGRQSFCECITNQQCQLLFRYSWNLVFGNDVFPDSPFWNSCFELSWMVSRTRGWTVCFPHYHTIAADHSQLSTDPSSNSEIDFFRASCSQKIIS